MRIELNTAGTALFTKEIKGEPRIFEKVRIRPISDESVDGFEFKPTNRGKDYVIPKEDMIVEINRNSKGIVFNVNENVGITVPEKFSFVALKHGWLRVVDASEGLPPKVGTASPAGGRRR